MSVDNTEIVVQFNRDSLANIMILYHFEAEKDSYSKIVSFFPLILSSPLQYPSSTVDEADT